MILKASPGNVNHADGEILRELRERLGLTQSGLAKRMGVGLRTISSAERGEHRIRLDLDAVARLIELLDQADMSIYDLTRVPRKPDRSDPYLR